MFSRSPHHGIAKSLPRDFPVTLELEYQVVRGPASEDRGMGRTLWISSREVVFETARPIPLGAEVEIAVAWPVLLEDRVGLQLWVRGQVVNSAAELATAAIRHYQFRTRSLVHASTAGG